MKDLDFSAADGKAGRGDWGTMNRRSFLATFGGATALTAARGA